MNFWDENNSPGNAKCVIQTLARSSSNHAATEDSVKRIIAVEHRAGLGTLLLDLTRGDTPERSSDLLLLYSFLNNTGNNIFKI